MEKATPVGEDNNMRESMSETCLCVKGNQWGRCTNSTGCEDTEVNGGWEFEKRKKKNILMPNTARETERETSL